MTVVRPRVRRAKHKTKPRTADAPHNWIVEIPGLRLVFPTFKDALRQANNLRDFGWIKTEHLRAATRETEQSHE